MEGRWVLHLSIMGQMITTFKPFRWKYGLFAFAELNHEFFTITAML
jgi:hypothetical protein